MAPRAKSRERGETPSTTGGTPELPAGMTPVAQAAADPLASATGRAWLGSELKEARWEAEFGPDGQGWAYNELKRPEITERLAFLEALTALI